jgi:hypothetical protein
LWVVRSFLFVQETKTMKSLFAIVLLVTAMAVTGCGETKKPATPPAPPANTGEKPAETPPATPPAEAPK